MEIEATWADVVENLDETAGLARFAGPGGWNDADMLEVRSRFNVFSVIFLHRYLTHSRCHRYCCLNVDVVFQ